ncbi:ATP-binding cassette domain-containing protein [Shimia sp. NS0008-38b]|uniref:ATP-binding cassette domain-containing protein n=1 Tax=Shimia sp. NS0008-38b TaxID=3127653 RepID=UPI00333F6A96
MKATSYCERHVMQAPLSQLKRLGPPLLALSAVSNLAVLISPIFMMQVLDRVLPTGNLHTLILLLAVASTALLVQASVDGLRDLSFQYSARWTERTLLPAILRAPPQKHQALLTKLATVKAALNGVTGAAALSLPWLPMFFLVLWLIHPWFVALACGLICLSTAARLIASAMVSAHELDMQNAQAAETGALSDAQSLAATAGLASLSRNLLDRLTAAMHHRGLIEDRITPISVGGATFVNFLRSLTQLLGLSLGAALVVHDLLSAGGMIAASLILTKSVTSFETVVNAWPDMHRVRGALAQLNALPAAPTEGTGIASLSGALRCEGLIFPRPGGAPPRLERISFAVPAGSCTAIVGASGCGKTTLLEAISGVAPCPIGTVWLEDTEVTTLPESCQTAHIGYLPQQAQLYHGTLAANISGFAAGAQDKQVIAAAKTAGVHGLISALPHSYDTDIGACPHILSAGQKQRVALARAIFHAPRYLFLDEPNALLDAAGERQLCAVLARLKKQGTTIFMVIHRSGLMGLADRVLALDNGRIADFGPRSEVLGRMSGGRRRVELPLQPDSLQDLVDWVGAQFTRGNDAELSNRTELIATELFNLTRASGKPDVPRRASFVFRFLSEQSCELTVSETGETAAQAKMERISQLLHHPDTDMGKLPTDEAALAVISQMSDTFDIANIDGQAVYRAAVSMRPVALHGMARH